MNSYFIIIFCYDKRFTVIVKAPSKKRAKIIAEPVIQNEITSRIFKRICTESAIMCDKVQKSVVTELPV
jgi:hypothetical protein